MAKVELRSNADGTRSLEVDGVRLKGVRATDVRVAAGEIDKVVVELLVLRKEGVGYSADDAGVILKPEVVESLVALGWKPPVESE